MGGHAGARRDQLRVQALDQVDQPGAAQRLRPDLAAVEDVGQLGRRRWAAASCGPSDDEHMRIRGGESSTVESNRTLLVVDVLDAQVPQLVAGHGVQLAEQPDQGLVRVHVRVGGPAAEQCPAGR